MKNLNKLIFPIISISLALSNITYISAEEKKDNKQDINEQANEYKEDTGFDGIVAGNPYVRGVEDSSYQRDGNYLLYAINDKTLYKDQNGYTKIADIPDGEVMGGTKRFGDFVYVTCSKGKGWVYVNNDQSQLREVDTIDTTYTTMITTSVYTQPFISNSFNSKVKLPAGTYKATKRSGYFVYVTNGKTSGWIMTQYNDAGKFAGSILGKFPSTKESLSVSSISGIPVTKKIIPMINENARPGIQIVPKYVTIHNTGNSSEGADALAHANLQYRGDGNYTSWHYQVDKGSIYQSVPMNEMAWHAGDGYTEGNTSTIAIEICENKDGNYAQAEKNAAKLTAQILYENKLPPTAVKMHKDWSGKSCPENIINMTKGSMGWTKFLSMVNEEYTKLGGSISLNVNSVSIYKGQSSTLKATATPSGTVSWSSSNTAVATVSSSGVIKGIGAGTATITATANGLKATATVTVKNPTIILNTSSISMYKGKTTSLSATSTPSSTVTWKSSNTNIATVSSTGVVKAMNAGKATITASSNGVSATATVTVTTPTIKLNTTSTSIYKNFTTTLKATTTPSGTVSWSSSNTKVASVSSTGVVKGISAGTATITATSNGVKATATITVKNSAVKMNVTSASLYKGYTTTLKATTTPANGKVTWSTSNSKVATVSSSGVVSGKGNGTAYIYASYNGVKASTKVTVKTGSMKLSATSTTAYTGIFGYTLKATPTPSNAKVTWKSSNTSIATVSSTGFVTGKKAGTVTITASINGASKTCRITFKSPYRSIKSLKTNVNSLTFNKVRSYQVKVSYNPSTATLRKVKWSTSNSKVATVTSSGYVKAVKKGTCYITATAHNGVKKTIKISVLK